MRAKSYVGQRFGRLVAIKRIRSGRGPNCTHYRCTCDCGKSTTVRYANLVFGNTRSCGCLSLERKRSRKQPDSTIKFNAKYRYYVRNAKVSNRVWKISKEEFKTLTEKSCSYCGCIGPNGLDRLDNNLGYTKSNVTPCCKRCNQARNDMTVDEFKIHIDKMYLHLHKEDK